ncbi:MAG: hypothetical protein LBK62_14630 [Treponema sp.]|nr:hypothetical protein [Treponema sp.]
MKISRLSACVVLRVLIPFVAYTLNPIGLNALEFRQGLIRLSINETTGRFSLYYLTDPSQDRYEPLFAQEDPRTSFLAVNVDSRVYRLGENPVFTIRLEKNQATPAIIFESSFLRVRQEFSFIKTPSSLETNGVKITVRLENKDSRQSRVGMRMLIDTNLGEGFGENHFVTDTQVITAETIVTGDTGDRWWVSQNSRLSLMGSIFAGVDTQPDFLHFANWKRLNDLPWKVGYTQGRNFNYLPYSMGDSAVCYYYEPAPLPSGETTSHSIFLAVEDPAGFGFKAVISPEQREADLTLMRDLMIRLDQFLAGEISMSREELADMERTIAQIKARYELL